MTVSAIWTAHCDKCTRWGYQSESEKECADEARRAGWVVVRSPRVAICPDCKDDLR